MTGNGRHVVIVTGAAGGIGAAVSKDLVAGGAQVALLDHDRAGLEAVANACGPSARGIACDLTNFEAVETAVADVGAQWGAVDAAVACAGIHDHSTLETGNADHWRRVLEANVLGVAHVVRAVLPGMYRRRSGHVVVVASVSGRVTYPQESMYIASKHAAVALVESLRQEATCRGVRTTLIEPGLVDTAMLRGNPFAERLLDSVTPLRPDDCARAVRFALEQPSNCVINEIVLRPIEQTV